MVNKSSVCKTKEYCIFRDIYITDGRACIHRNVWTMNDKRNYIDINVEAQIHTGPVNNDTDPSTVCRTKDGKEIAGVQLLNGKYCQCPDAARYFDPNIQACRTAEQVQADGNLTIEISW